MLDFIVGILSKFIAVMVVITFHEFAHAFAAYKCGDDTAKLMGRMTLNPFSHFDPLGIVAFVFAGFGWAKPVPVNPYNFRNLKEGTIWTSAAGVLINYLMAFLFYPLYILVLFYVCPLVEGTYLYLFLSLLFRSLFVYSLSFCVFNLLPLYPLDGFRIIDALDEKKGKVTEFLRNYGYYILLGLLVISVLANRIPIFGYIDILSYILTFATDVLGKPITLFWNWLLSFILL